MAGAVFEAAYQKYIRPPGPTQFRLRLTEADFRFAHTPDEKNILKKR
jgi:hypothetical protein